MRKTRVFTIGVLVAGLCLGLCGCKHGISYGNIPEETINFTVYPFSLDNTLMATGNYKYFQAGYMGVFVYHIGYMDEEFVAFEQACPVDWEDGCYVEYDPQTSYLKGVRCQNTFSSFDGFGRSQGSRNYALRKCKVTWMDAQRFLVSY